jgi:hypothetical protein
MAFLNPLITRDYTHSGLGLRNTSCNTSTQHERNKGILIELVKSTYATRQERIQQRTGQIETDKDIKDVRHVAEGLVGPADGGTL